MDAPPQQSTYTVADDQKPAFDRVFEVRICRPIAAAVPRSVHPNAISLPNHGVMWAVVLLAGASLWLEGFASLALLGGAACGYLASAILDNVDGMHARATGQCSKLGAVLDHGLDAPNVVLNAAGLVLMLQLPPLTAAAALVTATMVYNAQVVLEHHTERWIPPPMSGPAGQIACAVTLVAFGIVLIVVDRRDPTLDLIIDLFAWGAIATNVKQASFYVIRLRRLVVHHLKFVALCAGYAALYLLDVIDLPALVVLITCVSYRVTGTYVLHTVLELPRYRGYDLTASAWLVILAGLHLLGPFDLGGAAPYVAGAHIAALSVLDIRRHRATLARP